MKSIICGALLAALVSPSLADQYWVEYNYSTQTCSIMEIKSQEPAGSTAPDITSATAEGAVSDPANIASSSATRTNTSPENSDLGLTAAVIAWAGKKDVAEAAWYDAGRTLIGIAIRTPEQVVTEFKIIGAMYAIWARETATSEAARSDAAKAFIGTVSNTREVAERKIRVMRKCGLAQ